MKISRQEGLPVAHISRRSQQIHSCRKKEITTHCIKKICIFKSWFNPCSAGGCMAGCFKAQHLYDSNTQEQDETRYWERPIKVRSNFVMPEMTANLSNSFS